MMSACLITGDVNFDHLVKAIPARFLHCKVTSFSLSMLYLLTAAAKSLQSCPTLGNPIDGSPPGSTIPGILPPGKNTGVGCHFLLQCMKVKSQSEVAQSCPTLSDPMDWSLPGSSVHWIPQGRVLEWGATAFSLLISSESLNLARIQWE